MDGYELIDAGHGRRLERFGERVVDRPALGAEAEPRDRAAWRAADLRFDRERGWSGSAVRLEPWAVTLESLRFELRPTDSGQVGLFPEQMESWRWLREQARPGISVLNLFAYTGGSTLAAAAAGASVVHVDAARSAVGWARRNAELSDLAARPIRWIADDVEAFVGREQRRGRRYDGIVLDPPSYGHGTRGRTWRLEQRLAALLEACAAILAPDGFVVLTTHDPELDDARLAAYLRTALRDPAHVDAFELELHATSGARLWLGSCARMISAL